MPIGLIRAITTQKVLKTYINKGVKYHYLGSNQCQVGVSHIGLHKWSSELRKVSTFLLYYACYLILMI